MRLTFSTRAWAEYQHWIDHDRAVLQRVNDLIRDTMRSPFRGIGKPEPLQGPLRGLWSRRITQEHRLIYRVTGRDEAQALEIIACRHHYD